MLVFYEECICDSHREWEASTTCGVHEGKEKKKNFCVFVYCVIMLVIFIYSEPSVEVFQPSSKEGFSLGLQLKK